MSLELIPAMDMQSVASFERWQLDELAKPLNTALIRERKGPGGKMLKYIKGSDAIEQANHIFGIGKWGYRVLSRGRETVGDQTFYTADVELYVLGCPFPFPGEGEGVPQNNTVDQHAKARKEAVTDALKRALRHYGDQFGLCLYDEESLVENEAGDLVAVKNVHPSNAVHPAKPKVVDASPAQSGDMLQQAIAQVKHEFAEIYPEFVKREPDTWFETFQRTALGYVPTELLSADLGKLRSYLAEKRKLHGKKAPAASGK